MRTPVLELQRCRDPDQLDGKAGNQVDASVERVDLRTGDLEAECPACESLARSLSVVAEPELQQLARLDRLGGTETHFMLAQQLAGKRLVDELQHRGG